MPASHPAESRHLRTGSLNIPAPTGPSNGMMPAHPRFEGPRSPPNTAHVPCKFFRQGTCQAGSACPFSHDLALASETVCKYFAKGNCKFGPKCANIHLLPDGRRVNYSRGNFSIESAPIPMGNRVIPANYPQSSNSGLGNLFMRGDNNATYGPGPYLGEDDAYAHQLGRQPSIENGLPIIDTVHSSSPTPVYGSPRDEDHSRLGMGLSPVNAKVLSVMDAPLPASFDSNGISHAARYGPFPASVPSRLEPASPSLHNARDGRTSETLKLLHTSAFGSSDHLSPSNLPHDSSMGSSPPTWDVNGEYFGKRTMHSNALRHARPGLLSRSVPKVDRDWDSSEVLFEDYVPDSLANELLTPAEKARRGSMRAMDAEKSREIPNAPFTKYGSPIGGASPSRWGSYFQRQREEEDNSGLGRSMKHAVSQFGHVGSPLRNSSLANGDFNGRGGPTSSTSRNGVGSESLSALTQQFQRAKVSDDASGSSSSPHLHPNTARISSGSAGIIGKERERDRGLERHVSNGSVSSSVTGRFTTPIDEEDPSFVFSMEEDDDAQTRARKRASGGLSLGTTTWSYAGIAAGKGSNGTGSRGSSNKTETVGNR